MKTRAILALTAVAGFAAATNAQTPSFTSSTNFSMPLSWNDNGAGNGNGNGQLDSGEVAQIFFNASFTNQGGVAQFSPSIGTFSSGTILGIGSGFVDLNGAGGTTGTYVLGNNPAPQTNNGTTGVGVRSGWRIVGNASAGSVNAAGTGVTQIQFGQFPASPELANTLNPVTRMFAMLWTPGSFTNRTVTFSLAPASGNTAASVYLDLDGSVGASVYVSLANVSLGTVNIPVVPAPASLALLGLGGLVAVRRRR